MSVVTDLPLPEVVVMNQLVAAPPTATSDRKHNHSHEIKTLTYHRSLAPPKDIRMTDIQDEEGAVNTGSNLFVTGIAPALNEITLAELFGRYGEVENCSIMLDPHTKESRGFGFVKMTTSEQADAAKEALQGETHDGRTLSIEKARRARPRTPTPGKYFGPPKRGKTTLRTQLIFADSLQATIVVLLVAAAIVIASTIAAEDTVAATVVVMTVALPVATMITIDAATAAVVDIDAIETTAMVAVASIATKAADVAVTTATTAAAAAVETLATAVVPLATTLPLVVSVVVAAVVATVVAVAMIARTAATVAALVMLPATLPATLPAMLPATLPHVTMATAVAAVVIIPAKIVATALVRRLEVMPSSLGPDRYSRARSSIFCHTGLEHDLSSCIFATHFGSGLG